MQAEVLRGTLDQLAFKAPAVRAAAWEQAGTVVSQLTAVQPPTHRWNAAERLAVQTYLTVLMTLWILDLHWSDSVVANAVADLLGAMGLGGLSAWYVAGKAYDWWRGPTSR